ncbi:hypothetical protein BCR43DRAFT_515489 [Syncephalastrum racemosum]|uniref:Galactose oxidase n=1 Tax=Syncephalastrum racemosum TaxID=13706 RepID=A0A1X2H9N8_SYNRA|nr:hypothetical protein BCR43DRAFT_515489 [Syncephalastrum racemosum]
MAPNTIFNPAGQELHATNRPLYGASAATMNNTVYIYGGFYSVPPWNMEALWTVSASTADRLDQVSTDPYASPTMVYGALVATERNTLYSFGGHHPIDPTNTSLPPEPLRYYEFDMGSHIWHPLQKPLNISSPLERFYHSATRAGDEVYLFGGMNISGPLEDVFWQYHLPSDQWTRLETDVASRDGSLVLLGGYHCVGNYTTNPTLDKDLFPMTSATVFDTHSGQWREQPLQGASIPAPRIYHSAVADKNDRIVVCGGQDGAAQPFHTYLSAGDDPADMTAILDTHAWAWSIPQPSAYQPFPRSFAAAALVNDTKVIFGFGINYHTIYDGLYVFDSLQATWETPSYLTTSQHHDTATVISSTVVVSVLTSTLLVLGSWMLCRHLHLHPTRFLSKVLDEVWKPRAGEPLWAEITRFLVRLFFYLVFITVVIITLVQVRNSPIIEQSYHEHNSEYTVDVPDIRFCFDGWEPEKTNRTPFIQCSTDFGDACSRYIINITDNIQTGLNYYGDHLTCYLFRAPDNFHLSRNTDRETSNGSHLKFYFYGDQSLYNSTNAVLHTVLYNRRHDPNLPVYGIPDPYQVPFYWYDDDENAAFQSAEQENLRTNNAFDLDPFAASTGNYELIERQHIRTDQPWNYVGVGTLRSPSYLIESKAVSEPRPSQYAVDPQPMGSLHVFPISYQVTMIREQRAFTLLNAMGILGGIFGIILGLQTCLFGYRPRSPWGVVHRWSVGQMRRSLLQGLRSKFPKGAQVPIVHPVHRRFSALNTVRQKAHDKPITDEEIEEEDEPQEKRMVRLEERLHVFELLFQAYYINDEVFRSLASASDHYRNNNANAP